MLSSITAARQQVRYVEQLEATGLRLGDAEGSLWCVRRFRDGVFSRLHHCRELGRDVVDALP